MSDIFRKSSLEKISSIDQLDKMIGVSKVSSWFCLSGVAIIIIAALIFLFNGKIGCSRVEHLEFRNEKNVLW